MKKLLLVLCLSMFVFANDTQDFYKLIEKLEQKKLTQIPKIKKVKKTRTKIDITKEYALKGIYSLNSQEYALIDKKDLKSNSVKSYKKNTKIDSYKLISINKKTNTVILQDRRTDIKYTLGLK